MGTCVELEKCENLFVLRNKTPQNHFDRLYVTLSQCGFNRNGQKFLVCCTQSPFPLRSISESNLTPSANQKTVAEPVTARQKEIFGCDVSLDNRIFGGKQTRINEMPFTALLAYAKSRFLIFQLSTLIDHKI